MFWTSMSLNSTRMASRSEKHHFLFNFNLEIQLIPGFLEMSYPQKKGHKQIIQQKRGTILVLIYSYRLTPIKLEEVFKGDFKITEHLHTVRPIGFSFFLQQPESQAKLEMNLVPFQRQWDKQVHQRPSH